MVNDVIVAMVLLWFLLIVALADEFGEVERRLDRIEKMLKKLVGD